MNLFTTLTKNKEDLMLYEEGILCESGRLTNSGRDLVIDLLFQGHDIAECKKKIIAAIREQRKSNS